MFVGIQKPEDGNRSTKGNTQNGFSTNENRANKCKLFILSKLCTQTIK